MIAGNGIILRRSSKRSFLYLSIFITISVCVSAYLAYVGIPLSWYLDGISRDIFRSIIYK